MDSLDVLRLARLESDVEWLTREIDRLKRENAQLRAWLQEVREDRDRTAALLAEHFPT
jgi:hypothetical protein